MTLDTFSLLAAFAVVALTLLISFYFGTFRSTRSPYCGWWCVALAAFLGGASAYLLIGTPQQYWAAPLGNFLIVFGAASTWVATKTLQGPRPPLWQPMFAPVLTLILTVLGHPGKNLWAGGYIFLLAVCVMFGLTAFELWRMDRTYADVRVLLAITAGFASLDYFLRWIVYLADGPYGHVFTTYFGSEATTLINLMLLAVVSYSMSQLSHEQSTKELTNRATRDGLTGLLNRTEFMRLAANPVRVRKSASSGAALILADLDHFKEINDTFGHKAGDQVLRNFADACRDTVRSTDLAGRYGGEEFVLLLPGMSLDGAEFIAARISERFRSISRANGVESPTVSYGIGSTAIGTTIEESIASVDAALYQAKHLGRNRVSRVSEGDRPGFVGKEDSTFGRKEEGVEARDGLWSRRFPDDD